MKSMEISDSAPILKDESSSASASSVGTISKKTHRLIVSALLVLSLTLLVSTIMLATAENDSCDFEAEGIFMD